ncbi:hypothetical protein [Promicromonospora sp. NPDC060271]|uniref:hypothetical protein n=1 Tax=Promicromonospora sp. NPDC060271 TaxID=3347089 RepID=UPI003667D011
MLDVRVTRTVGQSFSFPTEQGCAGGGSYQWTDTDLSGDYPAPTFVATAASRAETLVTPATPATSAGTPPLPAGWLAAPDRVLARTTTGQGMFGIASEP